MAQSAAQLKAARELADKYGLTKDDFFQEKRSGAWLISRTGIEKVQYGANITVKFEAVRCEVDFAAVKATATRPVLPVNNTDHDRTLLTIQTFGSAYKGNCRIDYYLEMAEKRALSRAVLKLTDFYALGVYGEDEMPTTQEVPAHIPPAVTHERGVGDPSNVKAQARALEPDSVPMAVTGESVGPAVQYATAPQKEEIIRLLNNPMITRPEKTKVLLNIGRFDEERAAQAIAKLRKAIEDREGTTAVAA